ncbi:hypothetical protein O3Q51_09310 [Cryomorphaceae bacterium 1068]|nr:hypothetical protein [Cryomorphaceae bacterium 1068]
MASFKANSFIDSLSDPKTGETEKELSLLYLGIDLLDLSKKLEEARVSGDTESESLTSSKVVEKQSYPWWKLW